MVSAKKVRKLLFIKCNNHLAIHSILETTTSINQLHNSTKPPVQNKVDAYIESDLVGIAKITFSQK